MNEHPKGRIFTLYVGNDLKSYFRVGHDVETIDSKIVEIISDNDYLLEYGETRFLIIAEDKNKVKWVCSEVVGLPHKIQYEKPNNGQIQNIR